MADELSGHEENEPEPTQAAGDHTTSRRGFLGWLSRLGIAVVGSAAGVGALDRPAEASSGRLNVIAGCCVLARHPGGCPGSGPTFTCPAGWRKRVWNCCGGGRLQGCGECQSGTGDCHHGGTYKCSEHWTTSNVC